MNYPNYLAIFLHFSFTLVIFAVIINSLDMSKKEPQPPREWLSKRKSICSLYADSIYKTNPTKEQIEGALLRVFDSAYSEGYEDCSSDLRRQRDYREAKLKEGFAQFRQEIEDSIYKNK